MSYEQVTYVVFGAVFLLVYIVVLGIGLACLSAKRVKLKFKQAQYTKEEVEEKFRQYKIGMVLLLIPFVQVIFLTCWFFYGLGKVLRECFEEVRCEISHLLNKR